MTTRVIAYDKAHDEFLMSGNLNPVIKSFDKMHHYEVTFSDVLRDGTEVTNLFYVFTDLDTDVENFVGSRADADFSREVEAWADENTLIPEDFYCREISMSKIF